MVHVLSGPCYHGLEYPLVKTVRTWNPTGGCLLHDHILLPTVPQS